MAIFVLTISESSQWLGKNVVWSPGERNSRKEWKSARNAMIITEIMFKTALKTIQSVNQASNLIVLFSSDFSPSF